MLWTAGDVRLTAQSGSPKVSCAPSSDPDGCGAPTKPLIMLVDAPDERSLIDFSQGRNGAPVGTSVKIAAGVTPRHPHDAIPIDATVLYPSKFEFAARRGGW